MILAAVLAIFLVSTTNGAALRNENAKRDAIVSSEQNVVITSGETYKVLVNTRDILTELDSAASGIAALSATVTANHDSVTTALGTKADTSTVDAALALKADTTTVDAALATKADAAATTSALATKADATATTDALATKADAATTTSALATKADATTVNDALALKADTTTVNDALALKADAAATTTALAAKADAAATTTALAAKADAAATTTALAAKADAAATTTALAAKADAAATTTALAAKADAAATTTALAAKADKTALNAVPSSTFIGCPESSATPGPAGTPLVQGGNTYNCYYAVTTGCTSGQIPFENGWRSGGSSSMAHPSFMRDKFGWVTLNGLVTGGTCPASSYCKRIFRLPSGYAPVQGLIFLITSTTPGSVASITVDSSGNVFAESCVSGQYLSLSGIRFLAAGYAGGF